MRAHLNGVPSLLNNSLEENDDLVTLLQEVASAHAVERALAVDFVHLEEKSCALKIEICINIIKYRRNMMKCWSPGWWAI